MGDQPLDYQVAIARLEELVPRVAACAEEIEAARSLPPHLLQELHGAGAFRLLIPREFGGCETPFATFMATMQMLAAADASTAWCINQAAVIGTTSLWLPAAKIAEIWAEPDAVVANGPPLGCTLQPTADTYLLNGRWGFSSGCQHATWMMGAARYAPGGYRIAYFRPHQVDFTDTWQVAGLLGTGSFEFAAIDLVIPADQVADTAAPPTVDNELTRIPGALLFAASFAAVALGVAQGALGDMLALAQGKVPRFTAQVLQDDPRVQHLVGEAQARWRSARAYLYSTVEEALAGVRTGTPMAHAHRAALRMAGTHVIREAAAVVDLAYKVAGTTAIYQPHRLQRRFQDMHVITQHVQARESYYALLGRYAMTGQYELTAMT